MQFKYNFRETDFFLKLWQTVSGTICRPTVSQIQTYHICVGIPVNKQGMCLSVPPANDLACTVILLQLQ